MCAEALPWRCHRSLISDALTARGIEVEHIMGEKTQPHRAFLHVFHIDQAGLDILFIEKRITVEPLVTKDLHDNIINVTSMTPASFGWNDGRKRGFLSMPSFLSGKFEKRPALKWGVR
jgi:hypothetical protein